MINIDDFCKVEIKAGEILSVEKVEGSNKLLKLSVNFGEETPRQIISGIAKYFPDMSVLVGKKCAFCTNLEPRAMAGLESNGMIMAVSTEDGKFSLLEVGQDIPAGTKVK
jgi:methionyl-tRNA synthetase